MTIEDLRRSDWRAIGARTPKDLIDVARDPARRMPHRKNAIWWLGWYGVREAIPMLRELLRDPMRDIAGFANRSLIFMRQMSARDAFLRPGQPKRRRTSVVKAVQRVLRRKTRKK